MKKILAISFFASLPQVTYATSPLTTETEPPTEILGSSIPIWLAEAIKQNSLNPNELSYNLIVLSCPFTEHELDITVNSIMQKANIKAIRYTSFNEPKTYSFIKLECKSKNLRDTYQYSLQVFIGQYNSKIEQVYNFDFGSFGESNKETIANVFNHDVTYVIRAYVYATTQYH